MLSWINVNLLKLKEKNVKVNVRHSLLIKYEINKAFIWFISEIFAITYWFYEKKQQSIGKLCSNIICRFSVSNYAGFYCTILMNAIVLCIHWLFIIPRNYGIVVHLRYKTLQWIYKLKTVFDGCYKMWWEPIPPTRCYSERLS